MNGALKNHPLAQYTRFKTGGPAELYFEPTSADELKEFLHSFKRDTPIHILGGGSNVLIRDGGVKGLVIRPKFQGVKTEGDKIYCGSGVPCGLVAKFAADANISGLEFLACIPGTMGGALYGNAGCFGREMKDIFVSAGAVDLKTGEEVEVSPSFSYRSSGLSSNLLITSMELKGEPGDKSEITAKIAELFEKKSASQPVAEKTAGSTFKNPSPDKPAWELIEGAGLQGARVGGAEVSRLHANFIINTGMATSADIESLAELIRLKVREKSGITLEYEIKIIGSKV